VNEHSELVAAGPLFLLSVYQPIVSTISLSILTETYLLTVHLEMKSKLAELVGSDPESSNMAELLRPWLAHSMLLELRSPV
jgi:hypothetical protein